MLFNKFPRLLYLFYQNNFPKFSNNTTSFCSFSSKTFFPLLNTTLLGFLEMITNSIGPYKFIQNKYINDLFCTKNNFLHYINIAQCLPTVYTTYKKIYFPSWLTHCSTSSTVILVPFPFDKGIFQHRCFSFRINPCARLCNDLYHFISNATIYIHIYNIQQEVNN